MNSQFLINHKSYTKEQLQKMCSETLQNKQLSRWEHIVSRFILDWFDGSDSVLQKTSGSTGDPKSVMLRKNVMKKSAGLTCDFLNLKTGDTALLCLPADFIGGKMMIVRALTRGLNLLTVSPSSNPLKNIEQKVDFAAMVPLQVQTIMNEGEGLNIISKLIIGGGQVTMQLQDELLNSKCRCFETFGMTETYSHVALREINDEYFTTLEGIKVHNDSQGKLIITAPFISITPIQTNDMVEIKSPEKFKWLGRADHIINTGGIKIIPEQLECKLNNEIKKRFIFTSLPDIKLGEKLILVVEGKEDKKLVSQIKEIMKNKLNKYEIPKEIVFLEKFVQTFSMKINRKALSDILKAGKI